MEEKNVALNPCLSHFVGKGDHALQTCLPPLVGGRGTTKWWKGAAEGGIIKKLRRSRHHPPLNPLNLLNPLNPHVRILHRMRKSAEVGP